MHATASGESKDVDRRRIHYHAHPYGREPYCIPEDTSAGGEEIVSFPVARLHLRYAMTDRNMTHDGARRCSNHMSL